MEHAVTTSRTGRLIAWHIFSTWQVTFPEELLGAPFGLPPCVVAALEGSLALPRFGGSAFRAASV
jgi:hypothetical protein